MGADAHSARVLTLKKGAFVYTGVRIVGVFIAILAAFTGEPTWCWASVPFLFLTLWVSVVLQVAYSRNLPRVPCLRTPPPWPEGKAWPSLTLVAAARNEEEGIESAVRSFMACDYPGLSVLILDDHSTDATPAILDRLAAEYPNLRVVHDPPYQEGWGGKGNAIWHAVHHLLPEDCKWVLTTDADVKFDPAAVRSAVAHAESLGVDYLTCLPRFTPKSLAESLMNITDSWSLSIAGAFHQPKGTSRAIGMGPFLMFTRDIYVKSGGHAPFKARSPEDANLAGVIREAGGVMAVGWAADMVRYRMCRGYGEIRRNTITKARVYHYDSVPAILGILVHALASLVLPLPLAIVAVSTNPPSAPLLVYAALQFGSYLSETARFAGHRGFIEMPRFVPWLHPLGGLMRMWFAWLAIWRVLTGKPLAWRGRTWSTPACQNPKTTTLAR